MRQSSSASTSSTVPVEQCDCEKRGILGPRGCHSLRPSATYLRKLSRVWLSVAADQPSSWAACSALPALPLLRPLVGSGRSASPLITNRKLHSSSTCTHG